MGYLGFIFIGVLLIAIPIVIYFSIRFLWSKGKYGRLFLTIGTIGFAWLFYDAIYPSESFHVAELERLAHIKLPPEAKFIYKNATYPDIHGAYSACFIVNLPQSAWVNLQPSISLLPSHESKYDGCGSMDEKQKKLSTIATRYILTQRANRESMEMFIDYLPHQNIAAISWYQW